MTSVLFQKRDLRFVMYSVRQSELGNVRCQIVLTPFRKDNRSSKRQCSEKVHNSVTPQIINKETLLAVKAPS